MGFVAAVVKKFGDDQAGQLAALISYYGFVSLFPLMLVFVTILGFVLEDNPHEREKSSTVCSGSSRSSAISSNSIPSAVALPRLRSGWRSRCWPGWGS